MVFGALIIGDEILSGKRSDRHFARIADLLEARGLRLSWVEYLRDDSARIAASLRRSFAAGDVVFSFGGIGNTPDDHTRQAAALALGLLPAGLPVWPWLAGYSLLSAAGLLWLSREQAAQVAA